MTKDKKHPGGSMSFHEIEQKVRDWVATSDARAQLSEAYKVAAEANKNAELARQVEPGDLSEPFTL